jgi:hypothetical protein
VKRKPIKLTGFKVGKLTFKAGDYIVLKTADTISDEMARRIKDHFEMALKEHNVKVIVLGDGLDIFKMEFEK